MPTTINNSSTPTTTHAAAHAHPAAHAPLTVVIMAAGKGTRMKSDLPKVLHLLAGQSLLRHVLDAALALEPHRVVLVTGHGAQQVHHHVQDHPLSLSQRLVCVNQTPQLGTGHAVQQAASWLEDGSTVLVLNGDVPLIQVGTLRQLIQASQPQSLALLSVVLDDPHGYGRIVRCPDTAQVQGIVEHKDANVQQLAVREVYTGIMAAPAHQLKHWVGQLKNHNAQQEYYLTDVVAMAAQQHTPIVSLQAPSVLEVTGVNSPAQLASLEGDYQNAQAQRLLEHGVRLRDPMRVDIRGTLNCGRDVEIDINCIFEGQVTLGDRVRIGAHCVIANCHIDSDTIIHPFSHIDGEQSGVRIGTQARVGPFARLRPGAQLGAEVHIGNFVEIKNATLQTGTKANHLAYIGDASVGARVNFGAGSITANYDGANKHHTTLEDDVHVGSNCVLVAPVRIGAGGTVGAGSTITKNTEPQSLSVARGKQISIPHWERPKKKPKE